MYQDVLRASHRWLIDHDPDYRHEQLSIETWMAIHHIPPGQLERHTIVSHRSTTTRTTSRKQPTTTHSDQQHASSSTQHQPRRDQHNGSRF